MQEGMERTGRLPNQTDRFVGGRIRSQRKRLGVSQATLAKQIGGVTYQQVQKYEAGTNRVAAGTLFRIAQVLDVPINFFYEQGRMTEVMADDMLGAFLGSREGIVFNRAFAHITDHKVRRSIVTLVRALATERRGTPKRQSQ